MNAPALRVITRAGPTPAERARQAQDLAASHALEAIQDALRAVAVAKEHLDGLADLPVKPGIVQASTTMSRALVSGSLTVEALVGRAGS